jgi:ring-1,2-phenylacetyl-CoA epoxidase subunit PaaE
MSILRERLLTSKQQGTNNSPKIHRAGRKITLLYGSRTYNDIIFREEIDRIRAPWFKKRYLLSQEKTKASAKLRKDCLSGYIDEKVIRRFVPEPAEALFYICGPEALKKSVQTVLRRLKVPRQAIFFEDFFW